MGIKVLETKSKVACKNARKLVLNFTTKLRVLLLFFYECERTVERKKTVTPTNRNECICILKSFVQIGPVPYHSRTNHMFPEQNNQMQKKLDNLNEYSRLSKMSINQQKK